MKPATMKARVMKFNIMSEAMKPKVVTPWMQVIRGFSLLELMLSLVLISILVLIAVPSYQRYIERKDLAMAKQAALKIVAELEMFKARNFSYQGFDLGQIYPSYDAAQQQLHLPLAADPTRTQYVLSLVDLESKRPLNLDSRQDLSSQSIGQSTALGSAQSSAEHSASVPLGLGWAISVVRAKTSTGELKQPHNYDLLLNSTGLRCMTQQANRVETFQDCGDVESQTWD